MWLIIQLDPDIWCSGSLLLFDDSVGALLYGNKKLPHSRLLLRKTWLRRNTAVKCSERSFYSSSSGIRDRCGVIQPPAEGHLTQFVLHPICLLSTGVTQCRLRTFKVWNLSGQKRDSHSNLPHTALKWTWSAGLSGGLTCNLSLTVSLFCLWVPRNQGAATQSERGRTRRSSF